jgi:hypothetical protein
MAGDDAMDDEALMRLDTGGRTARDHGEAEGVARTAEDEITGRDVGGRASGA